MGLIDETPTILPVQKEFFLVMISERKAKILDYSMEQFMKLERQELEQEENQGQRFSYDFRIANGTNIDGTLFISHADKF